MARMTRSDAVAGHANARARPRPLFLSGVLNDRESFLTLFLQLFFDLYERSSTASPFDFIDAVELGSKRL